MDSCDCSEDSFSATGGIGSHRIFHWLLICYHSRGFALCFKLNKIYEAAMLVDPLTFQEKDPILIAPFPALRFYHFLSLLPFPEDGGGMPVEGQFIRHPSAFFFQPPPHQYSLKQSLV